LISVYEKVLDSVAQDRRRNVSGQLSLFGDHSPIPPAAYRLDSLPDIEEYPFNTLLSMEKEMTGVYISGHPLDEYKEFLEGCHTTLDILNLQNMEESESLAGEGLLATDLTDGSSVTLGGIITDKKVKYTKNNSMMAFLTLEDLYGSIEIIAFPTVYSRYAALLDTDKTVILKGRISLREDEEPKVICNEVESLVSGKKHKLYIKIARDRNPDIRQDICSVLKKYRGNVPVYLYLEATEKTYKSSPDLWIRRDSALLQELTGMLGDKCVKMI
jgi:DNA polymerase-3 subunit alpha